MFGSELPADLLNEREAIIAEILEVFAGVTREGGTSWGQSIAASKAHQAWQEENVPKPDELFKGRQISWSQLFAEDEENDDLDADCEGSDYAYHDLERNWWDLVDDQHWHPDPEYGGFSFLDPIGCRYYLPAAMVRDLQDHEGAWLSYKLTVNDFIEGIVNLRTDVDWRAYFLETWSELTHRQRLVVKRFVRFKMAVERVRLDAIFLDLPEDLDVQLKAAVLRHPSPWSRAYASYWENLENC